MSSWRKYCGLDFTGLNGIRTFRSPVFNGNFRERKYRPAKSRGTELNDASSRGGRQRLKVPRGSAAVGAETIGLVAEQTPASIRTVAPRHPANKTVTSSRPRRRYKYNTETSMTKVVVTTATSIRPRYDRCTLRPCAGCCTAA